MKERFTGKFSNFNKQPVVEVENSHYQVVNGWEAICQRLNDEVTAINRKKILMVVETYQGVIHEELISNLKNGFHHTHLISAEDFYLHEVDIKKLVFPDVTDDRIFGFLTRLTMDAFFCPEKVATIDRKSVV